MYSAQHTRIKVVRHKEDTSYPSARSAHIPIVSKLHILSLSLSLPPIPVCLDYIHSTQHTNTQALPPVILILCLQVKVLPPAFLILIICPQVKVLPPAFLILFLCPQVKVLPPICFQVKALLSTDNDYMSSCLSITFVIY